MHVCACGPCSGGCVHKHVEASCQWRLTSSIALYHALKAGSLTESGPIHLPWLTGQQPRDPLVPSSGSTVTDAHHHCLALTRTELRSSGLHWKHFTTWDSLQCQRTHSGPGTIPSAFFKGHKNLPRSKLSHLSTECVTPLQSHLLAPDLKRTISSMTTGTSQGGHEQSRLTQFDY